MRIAGMASGMDIDQMVADLMRAERAPQDKYVQEQTFKNWQVDAYRELNTKVNAFEQSVFDRLLTPSNFLSRTGTSSNSDLVSVTSSSGTENLQYTVSDVEQLASAAVTRSDGEIGEDHADFDPSRPLGEAESLNWEIGTVQTELLRGDGNETTFTFGEDIGVNSEHPMIVRVDGESHNVVTDGEPLEGEVLLEPDEQTLTFAGPVANASRVEVQYVDNDTEGRFMFTGAETFGEDGGTVRHEGFITGDDHLENVLNEFNNSALGIQAFYDEHADQVSVSRTETGVFNPDGGNEIIFDEGSFFTEFLQLGNEEEQGAQNAQFTVNGLKTERQSNTFSLGHLTMTLHDEFAQDVSVSSSVDTDTIVENITEFVEEYNGLLAEVHGQLEETRNREYPPLTDEQRRDMTEHEIGLWEEQAQSGLLSHDRQLGNFMSQMRSNLYETVNVEGSDIQHLSDLGITTSNDYLERGRLEVDESQLRSVVEEDPEGAFNFFSQTGTENGIARNLRATVNDMEDEISRQAGGSLGRHQNHQFVLGREIDQLDDRIENFDRRLEQIEDRYWRQFTAMEQAVAEANNQSQMFYNFMFGDGQ
ncbi:flagellar filament capping protein FliD [Natribacillus halophilus]|uniref:Flagellar hook-associated protein 2 n=1 Tax=Natribacillus halophilus TaxID=549003 RepID=A0A1G8KNG4_9BACI|nr:flagellar filament capping protein FliD [Natribacillus halophilus]SDI44943.1 flagellar hook-associated protein 2 [Natribacillus halophilus]